ncbi:bifunctional phosphopantothenoylcysteine decarboxylase/phosphopantothenate--cysteine ligase CoaBC [Alicyclobacillus sp. SO9]|uniref:bifunctional phosphopantothenoylcysteine decarboxylase/phosphopantothenate--cysteine ligase CoaBC n=1 Tax=Alicyclobacillus sp. SO9 TaxID=2665646 RepID=UPI0018E79391|nr:bifunctional phosphopantothenoylcysteine decarboxylase/phosphopantothenate--cysteine ligase CoaBC [Alicyclobacillus sp. SO9]QQE80734.1 bifunctional phosphopantothenoylcysteine decarboxylase/phosphopantothenate--cysteine ligase CoaBC [Alicyclobacillus sp. SO9]
MARILVGVGGGIAAYKAASLCSLLMKAQHEVQVLMTENATKFITPLTLQSLTRKPVVVDTFNEPNPTEIAHIALADKADLYVIAPATANLIGKLAAGIADDMVSTTALAVTSPLLIAPAMNVHMFEHPAVQQNLATLRHNGALIINPGSGPLACGYTGKGRLAEPEDILQVITAVLNQKTDMAGVHLVVTAGPTIEDIDPVRYLSNNSSGKMGYALAEAGKQRGARVTLISGPTNLPDVSGIEMIRVRSTQDMYDAVDKVVDTADIYISAAAPVDFRPVVRHHQKLKKGAGVTHLELEQTTDILLSVAGRKQPSQTFVGFAAETSDVLQYGMAKLERKNLDMVVVNDILAPGAGFAGDTNVVTILMRGREPIALPVLNKFEVANRILDQIQVVRHEQTGGMDCD